MKKLLHTLIPLFLWPLLLQAQTANISAIDTYFSHYVDDERFSVVYVSAKLFSLMKNISVPELKSDDTTDNNDLIRLLEGIEGLRVLRTNDTPLEFYAEAKNKIDTKLYEILMTVREKTGKNTEFLIKSDQKTGKVQELLLLSGSSEEFVLLSFIGNLNLDDISRFAKKISSDN